MAEVKSTTEAAQECLSCSAISGARPISPGPRIFEGEHWLVDHAYPSALKGWLVLVTKRHVEALHDLAPQEFAELGELLGRTVGALHATLDYEKEYTMCFAEAHGYKHIHFHVIPKPHELPRELRSGGIFGFLDVDEHTPVPRDEVSAFCQELKARL